KMPKICVLIPTYKRNSVFDAINSVISQSVKVDEIIIIDNDRNSNIEEVLKDINDIKISYYKQKENLGGAGAYSLGIRTAFENGFDFVYAVEDDIICDKQSIEKLINSEVFSDSVVLSSVVLSPSNEIEKIHHKKLDHYLNQKPVFGDGIKYINDLKEKYFKIDANSFAGLFIPRKVIEVVGYPDPDYFIWYDDLEYTYRISKKFNIYVIRDSFIFHMDDTYFINNNLKTIPVNNLYKVYYGIRNSLIFRLSYLSFNKKLIIILETLFYVLKISLRVIKTEEDKIKRLRVLWLGFFDGVLKSKKRNGVII
ncbi:MAG TPA: glycosyltransferase, partial [Elusimicrobiales bacterium]|nr:glycosyltransferase [Elusimicrobiales bacterium]